MSDTKKTEKKKRLPYVGDPIVITATGETTAIRAVRGHHGIIKTDEGQELTPEEWTYADEAN